MSLKILTEIQIKDKTNLIIILSAQHVVWFDLVVFFQVLNQLWSIDIHNLTKRIYFYVNSD